MFTVSPAVIYSVDTSPNGQLFPVRVPDHAAVWCAALAADHNIGQSVLACIPSLRGHGFVTTLFYCGSSCKLLLGAVVGVAVDYRGVAVVQYIFVLLAVVLNPLVSNAVNGVALLQYSVPGVLLIFEDIIDITAVPCGAAASSGSALCLHDVGYVDIPIWLRTTSLNDQTIYVTGYVTDKTAETNDNADADDLYKAVRVAVLGGETDATAGITTGSGTGLVVLKDCGAFADLSTATYYANKPNMTSEFGILDSDNYSGTGTSNKSGTDAVGRMSSPDGAIYGISAVAPTHTEITYNDGSSAVVTIPGATDSSAPGTAKKLIIRVWLEGEDGNCWNENANQDWNISLKFMKDALTAGT